MQFKSIQVLKSYHLFFFPCTFVVCIVANGTYAGEFILTNLTDSGTVVQLDFDGDKDPKLVVLRFNLVLKDSEVKLHY